MYLTNSGGSETLRNSACVHIPFQQTLIDYTHYVQASTGFSNEFDQMLIKVAGLGTCPDREKCTILLLDEMHIREDFIFDKHTGDMIGFSNLGDINEHLFQLEKSMLEDEPIQLQLARSTMVFIAHELFNSLQFPYIQFPSAELSGEKPHFGKP